MLGIALNLGRSPHMAFDQNRHCRAAERNRAREVERPPRNDVFGLTDVGDDGFGGCLVQAPTPANAREALINLRKLRRPFGSFHSEA